MIAASIFYLAMLASDLAAGMAMYRARRFSEAETQFRRAIASEPKNADARLWLARTLKEMNRIPEALSEVEHVLSGKPTAEVQFQAGRILRDLAEKRFADLQSVAADSAGVHELAGARWERSGDLDAALREYRAAAAMEPQRPGVHYRIGNVLWRQREVAPAEEALAKELAINPHHALASLRMGQLLMARGDDTGAIPYLERSAAAIPESIEARRELGKAYAKAKRLKDAQREWEAIAKARPDDDQVHYLLGNLYREMGDQERARRELGRHREILERRRAR